MNSRIVDLEAFERAELKSESYRIIGLLFLLAALLLWNAAHGRPDVTVGEGAHGQCPSWGARFFSARSDSSIECHSVVSEAASS